MRRQGSRIPVWRALPFAAALIFPSALSAAEPPVTPPPAPARVLTWHLIASYPHATNAFTEGLVWYNGGFYESTGQFKESSLRRVEFPSGKVLKQISLPDDIFGEGLALHGDRLVQLTWKTHQGFIYERDTFKKIGEFKFPTEGWGMTFDGTNFVMSVGTPVLYFLDPKEMKPLREIKVTYNAQPVPDVNELEIVEGTIWANVWRTDILVGIDATSGRVHSLLDLRSLNPVNLRGPNEDVLNGIAYDPKGKRFFVTGKYWPKIYELEVEGITPPKTNPPPAALK